MIFLLFTKYPGAEVVGVSYNVFLILAVISCISFVISLLLKNVNLKSWLASFFLTATLFLILGYVLLVPLLMLSILLFSKMGTFFYFAWSVGITFFYLFATFLIQKMLFQKVFKKIEK